MVNIQLFNVWLMERPLAIPSVSARDHNRILTVEVVNTGMCFNYVFSTGCRITPCEKYPAALFRYHIHNSTFQPSSMFANLPRKLTAPLGLLSDEAKLAFRSHPEGISKLISTRVSVVYSSLDDVPIIFVAGPLRTLLRVIATGIRFVIFSCTLPGCFTRRLQYFVLFDTPSDVFSLISPHDST